MVFILICPSTVVDWESNYGYTELKSFYRSVPYTKVSDSLTWPPSLFTHTPTCMCSLALSHKKRTHTHTHWVEWGAEHSLTSERGRSTCRVERWLTEREVVLLFSAVYHVGSSGVIPTVHKHITSTLLLSHQFNQVDLNTSTKEGLKAYFLSLSWVSERGYDVITSLVNPACS